MPTTSSNGTTASTNEGDLPELEYNGYVRNDETGESAYFDYYPDSGLTVVGNVDQNRIDAHASLTIETNAEQEQAILDGIKAISQSAPDYSATPGQVLTGCESTCVTRSENLLKLGGINLSGQTPTAVWNDAVQKYANDGTTAKNWPSYPNPRTFNPGVSTLGTPNSLSGTNPQMGREYGHDPRGQSRRWDPSATNAKTKTFFSGGKIVKQDRY